MTNLGQGVPGSDFMEGGRTVNEWLTASFPKTHCQLGSKLCQLLACALWHITPPLHAPLSPLAGQG